MYKENRRLINFIINPKYQIKYILLFILFGCLLTSFNAAVFFYFTRMNYKVLVDLSPMEEVVKLELYGELNQIVICLVIFSVFFTILASLVGVVISHRTAGALYHFKRVFREIQSGKLEARIHLRKKDEFKDVAEECNRMINFLQKKS